MLGIVVRSWNAYEYTQLTIDHLLKNTIGDFIIVVVDNGSNNDTLLLLEERCKDDSRIQLIKNGENLGLSRATTIGIEALDTDLICIIDNDVLVPYGWNDVLESELVQHNLGIIGPNRFTGLFDPLSGLPLRSLWNSVKETKLQPEALFTNFSGGKSISEFSDYLISGNNLSFSLIESPPGYISGSLMMFRRDVYERNSGFGDTTYDLYGAEDVDFCWSAGLNGFRIGRSGKVYVHHFEGSSISDNNLDSLTKTIINNKKLIYKWNSVLKEYVDSNISRIQELKKVHPFLRVFLGEIDHF